MYLFIQKEAGVPKKIIKVEDIPGLSKFFNFAGYFILLISHLCYAKFNVNFSFMLSCVGEVELVIRSLMNILVTGEAGWTPDQWGHSRFGALSASTDSARKHLTAFMRALLKVSCLSISLSSCLLFFIVEKVSLLYLFALICIDSILCCNFVLSY